MERLGVIAMWDATVAANKTANLPSAGFYVLFIDTGNANKLSTLDPAGVVLAYTQP